MTVTTGNTPPNLTPIADVTLDEGQAMEVNATATDADLPGDRISYSLVAAPPSMAIGAVSGRITWTTTEADGPGRYPVTVRATDNCNAQHFAPEPSPCALFRRFASSLPSLVWPFR